MSGCRTGRWRRDPRGKPRYNQLYESLAPSTLATWGTHRQRAVFTGGGRRVRSSSTLEKTAGTPMGDVWDIGVIAPIAIGSSLMVMIFAGGIPLKKDGKVVGAIGVSGGSGEQDHAVAEAGAAAF